MRRTAPAFLLPFALLGVMALAACGGDSDDKLKQADQPVGNLYNDAYDKLREEDYKKAAEMFEEVERQHPYSNWATQADLMAAFSQYQGLHYDDAIADLDRFIQLHPGHKDIAYAYYLKALSYFEQINDVRRDQTETQTALAGFEEVVRRFPDTVYAKDAVNRINLCRDRLASKDMDVGRYYEQRGLYIAAIQRFRNVAEQYQTTTQTPEALLRLVECYKALGLEGEARRTAAVLGYNYPASSWYKDAYKLVSSDKPYTVPPAQPATTPTPVSAAPGAMPMVPAQSQAQPSVTVAPPAAASPAPPLAQPTPEDDSGWFDGWFDWF